FLCLHCLRHTAYSSRFLMSFLIFLLPVPPPPRPTLFPYTTLFRSEPAERCDAVALADAEDARVDVRRAALEDQVAVRGRRDAHRDRKSTRLNSSHVSTSYAVFCLKKKNRYEKLTSRMSQREKHDKL